MNSASGGAAEHPSSNRSSLLGATVRHGNGSWTRSEIHDRDQPGPDNSRAEPGRCWREAEGKTHTRTSPGTEVECRGCGSIDVRQEKAIPCWGCVAARLVEGVPPRRTIASTDAVLAGRMSILRSRFLCNLRYHPSA
jgi:hypothetical protein